MTDLIKRIKDTFTREKSSLGDNSHERLGSLVDRRLHLQEENQYSVFNGDLATLYGNRRCGPYKGVLESIREINPWLVRSGLLALCQLYFDNLVTEGRDQRRSWKEEERILSTLCEAGKIFIGSFYAGEGGDIERVRELILPIEGELTRSVEGIPRKTIHLIDRYGDVKVAGKFMSENYKERPETLVAVAASAFEPAFLLMNVFPESDMLVGRYSTSRRDGSVKLPESSPRGYATDKINGKTVLVVEDSVCTGRSILNVAYFAFKAGARQTSGFSVVGNVETVPELRIKSNGCREVTKVNNDKPLICEFIY